jgi:hypothetical protein
MSDATKDSLDAALAAHIADECDGALVSGYVLQAAYFNGDTIQHGTTGYMREFADNQAFHVGYGLASQLLNYYRNPDWYEEEDDD